MRRVEDGSEREAVGFFPMYLHFVDVAKRKMKEEEYCNARCFGFGSW